MRYRVWRTRRGGVLCWVVASDHRGDSKKRQPFIRSKSLTGALAALRRRIENRKRNAAKKRRPPMARVPAWR